MKGVSQKVDSEEGVTESESDDSESEESGEHESDHDCEVIGGKETAIAHEELLLNSSSLLRRKWTKSAKYRYVMSKAGVRPSKQMEGGAHVLLTILLERCARQCLGEYDCRLIFSVLQPPSKVSRHQIPKVL